MFSYKRVLTMQHRVDVIRVLDSVWPMSGEGRPV